ncbi:MAG: hypothetical protein IPO18_20525 [bacterium]|nr:hypothetical protein [bacterium]
MVIEQHLPRGEPVKPAEQLSRLGRLDLEQLRPVLHAGRDVRAELQAVERDECARIVGLSLLLEARPARSADQTAHAGADDDPVPSVRLGELDLAAQQFGHDHRVAAHVVVWGR